MNLLARVELRRQQIVSIQKVDPSTQFNGELFDFQKEGLDFLIKTNGVTLLADDMGLGKGVSTLAYLATEKNVLPVLVVAPLTTLENWRREILRFVRLRSNREGDINPDTFTSPRIKVIRTGEPEALYRADFYIINYDLLHKRRDDLASTGIKTIVSDEIQNLRNADTKRYEAIKEISNAPGIEHRIGLSGTPIYNHGIELWPIIDFLYPGLMGTQNEFVRNWCNHYNPKVILTEHRQALYQFLKENIMIRRRKVEVMKELPEKTRYREQIEIDEEYYHKEMSRITSELGSKLGLAKVSLSLINQAYNAFNTSERQIAGISKIPYVVEFVEKMMELEEGVVVFCHHHIVHGLLMQKLSQHRPAEIIGGQPDKVRQMDIDRFQKGDTKLMIAGIRAGSIGINLTAANYVVFAELDWTPSIHRQGEDRCIAKGQLVHVRTKGLIPIEYIIKGDYVLTDKGRFKPVLATHSRQHRGLMTEITYKRWDKKRPLLCTHDHKLLVSKRGGTEPQWVEAHSVLPGDFLLMPRPTDEVRPLTKIEFPDEYRHNPNQVNQFGASQRNGRYKPLPKIIEVDDKLIYLFGWYLAEGWASLEDGKGKYVALAGHRREIPILKRLGERLRLLGLNYSIYERKTVKAAELHIYSIELAKWFKGWFGTGAHSKHVPEVLMNLPLDQTKVLLKGYIDGDGYRRRNRNEWITVANSLISQVAILVLKLGHSPGLRWAKEAKCWVGGFTINGNPDNKALALSDNKYEYNPVSEVRTYSISSVNRSENRVYDLTIADDHSFVVGLATVHNCHRIGQEKPVFAYYLEGKGTIDEAIAGVLTDKTLEIDDLLGEAGLRVAEDDEARAKLILKTIENRLAVAKQIKLPDKDAIKKEQEAQKVMEAVRKNV